LSVHGHFYQPDRADPFTGRPIPDPSAGASRDWTARIADEAYAPNAAHGNFVRMSWDLGPTLAGWLRRERPALHDAIARQDDGTNALAQAYHHTILPYGSVRDRRTEVRWALRDFALRFGRPAAGLWLPETALDPLTLRICAEEGVRWTILAPWQAEGRVVPGRPYAAALGGIHRLGVVFYDAERSAAVSFDPSATMDADHFVETLVRPTLERGEDLLIATDGELYGHHQPFRELFLQRLLSAGDRGTPVVSVGRAFAEPTNLAELPPVIVRASTSWSCHHGILRWGADCPCARDGRWKAPLRGAFDRLAAAIDVHTEAGAGELGVDAWAARDRFVDVVSEFAEPGAWAASELERVGRPSVDGAERLLALMRAQASRLAMFASDAWFWDDPLRPEPAQALRRAAHALRLIDGSLGTRLEGPFLDDLGAVVAPGGAPDGRELYRTALQAVGQPA
jgi:hypothetical protein